MADEFDYASIVADPNLMDPEYDISRIKTTTPTSERLLADVPEYSGLRFDPTQKSVYSDLYSLYSGGLDSYLANVDPSTGTVDTSVGTGGGGGGNIVDQLGTINQGGIGVNTPFEQNLIDQGVGVQAEPGAPISAPGEGKLTQQAIDDLANYPINTDYKSPYDTGDANIAEQIAAEDRIAKARADEQALTNLEQARTGQYTPTETYIGGDIPLEYTGAGIDEMYATDYYPEAEQTLMGPGTGRVSLPGGNPIIRDEPVELGPVQPGSSGNIRLQARGDVTTTPDNTYDPMDPPMLGNTGASMDYMSGSLDAPYGVNPDTGIPYQEPRTIADQLLGQTFEADEVDAQGNLLQKGVDKLKEMGIDPVVTAFKLGVNTIVGKPISLLADVLGAMDLPGGPTFQTQKAIELGLAGEGETQDIYGINTQSAFGNYDEYNVDRVEELEAALEKARDKYDTEQEYLDMTTYLRKELKDRKKYVDRSGAGGDIQPDATDIDIAADSFLGDGAVAEDAQDLNLMDVKDDMAGVETGDASVAEEIAAADRAAKEAAQRAEDEARARAREEARVASIRAQSAGSQGDGQSGSGAVTTGAGRNPWGRAKGGLIRKQYGSGGIVSLKNAKK